MKVREIKRANTEEDHFNSILFQAWIEQKGTISPRTFSTIFISFFYLVLLFLLLLLLFSLSIVSDLHDPLSWFGNTWVSVSSQWELPLMSEAERFRFNINCVRYSGFLRNKCYKVALRLFSNLPFTLDSCKPPIMSSLTAFQQTWKNAIVKPLGSAALSQAIFLITLQTLSSSKGLSSHPVSWWSIVSNTNSSNFSHFHILFWE